jgi:hypothetical protein
MSYIVIRVYSFECDHPGCDTIEEGSGPYITDAIRELRRWGWTIRRGGDFCPKHAGGDALEPVAASRDLGRTKPVRDASPASRLGRRLT